MTFSRHLKKQNTGGAFTRAQRQTSFVSTPKLGDFPQLTPQSEREITGILGDKIGTIGSAFSTANKRLQEQITEQERLQPTSIPERQQVPSIPMPEDDGLLEERLLLARKEPEFQARVAEVEQANKERKELAQRRLDELEAEQKNIFRTAGRTPTAEQQERVRQINKEFSELQAITNPAGLGAISALPFGEQLLGMADPATGVDTERVFEQARQEPGFTTGAVASQIGQQAAIYNTVGNLLRGTALGKKILGEGASGVRQIVGQQAADLFVDTVIQTPQEVFRGIKEDKTLGEQAKSFVANRALDVLLNAVMGGVTGDFKRAFNDDTVQTALKQANIDPEDVVKAVDSGDNAVLQDIKSKLSTKLEDVGLLETPVKQLDENRLPMSERIQAAQTQFAEGEIPEFTVGKLDVPGEVKPELPETKSIVLTELPKKPKVKIKDTLERVYQETVSKNAPFESIARKTGVEDISAKAGNLNRTTGTIDYNISKAQSNMEGQDVGLSMQDIFKDVPEANKQDLFDYMLNKHNIDRIQEGKPVFGDIASDAASSQKVASYEATNPEFIDVQKNVNNYFDNLMNEWAVKSGLISEDTARMLKDKYPDYVPTYRAVDIDRSMGGGSGNFVSNILKKAKGSERAILPLDQQMAMLTDRTIRNARKNEIMLSLDDVFTNNPEAISHYVKSIDDVPAKTVDDIIDIGKELEKEVVRQGDDFVVTYYKNGQPKKMTVNKTLYEAMRTMEQDGLDKVLNVIRKSATNPFKALITQYNPLFAVRNIMRDVPTALIYSNDTANLIKNVPKATQEMLTNGPLWKQYQAMGGTRSGLFNYEKGVKINYNGGKLTPGQAIKSGVDKIEAFNNFTETLPRFAEFVSTMEKTNNLALAVMRAAEITTDFSRFGKQTKRADAVVPYLNASVQGLDKFARQLRDRPLQTIGKGGLVITVPTLILDQVNKNNEAYNNMTARERNQYYHIPREDGTFWRIPRSREVGALLGSTFEWLSRASRGQEVTAEEIMNVAKENFTPVNGFDSNILKPAANFWKIATGSDPDAKNFFGSKIVPSKLQKYSPSQQFDEQTTSVSKALGEYFNVSPKAFDYLFDSYLGVIADVGMPYLTNAEVDWKEPFERGFIADPVFKSDQLNQFYNLLNDVTEKSNDANREFNIPSKLVTPLEQEKSILNKVSRQLSELRKQQNELNLQGKEDAAREIRAEMNAIASKAQADAKKLESDKKMQDLLKRLRGE